ncbi:MAG: chemotaxis protein [Leptospiraceae bacterium]|nr:MAG: chemotaxis protein [Leptospiraceae bacterium]
MIDEKYLELFLDEANEHIDDLNRSILELEQDKNDPEIINEIFRVAHTLKSSAGFVGLEYLSRLAHRMEDLFQLIRDQKIQVNQELINLLFACLDAIKNAVANVQDNKEEDKDALNELVYQIDQFIEYELKSAPKLDQKEELSDILDTNNQENEQDDFLTDNIPKELSHSIETNQDISEIQLTEEEKQILKEKLSSLDRVYHGVVILDEEAPMKNLRLLLIYNKLSRVCSFFKIEPTLEELEKNSQIDHISFIIYGSITKEQIIKLCQIDLVQEIHIKELDIKSKSGEISKKEKTESIQIKKTKSIKEEKDFTESVIKSKNIKVASEKIDYILNNVGELVITNSGLQKIYEDLLEEFGESQILSDLKSKIDQAIRIARELQSGVMKMRMMPVGIVFQRFFRPVRDLALSLRKKVELKVIGEDTELDKNIIDSLNDPLMHLIRNAIDHGIESPEERIKKGKPEVGTIILKSYQSGNHIFIEIQDDGRGLDKEKIYKKAVSLGLIDEKAKLSDQEIFEFIFHPGFSTAAEVSNVSGRGVGMNVVKEVVDEFKGSIQIHTEQDKGTSFILMFPLTLAIISTIHVKIENEEYAFPLSDVVETIRISPSQITTLQGRNIINLRKEIVPIYELSVLMGLPSKLNGSLEEKQKSISIKESEESLEKEFPVVVTSIGNRKIGYIVDEMIGKKEIVIKSLEQNYKQIPGLIGACLLGDGSIVMVLDVNGLVEIATKNYKEQLTLTKNNQEVKEAIERYNKKVIELSTITKRSRKRVKNYKKINIEKNEFYEIPEKNKTYRTSQITIVENKEESLLEEEKEENFIQQSIPEHKEKIKDEAKETITILEEKPEFIENNQTIITKEQEILKDFQKDKERRKKIGLEIFKDEEEIELVDINKPLFIEEKKHQTIDFLTEKDYEKLYSIINSGMVNAGLVLSQLLGVTIDVSVPDFKTISYEQISDFINEGVYYNVFLETSGEFESFLALSFDESTGIYTAGELMGIPEEHRKKEELDLEDIKSVLNELTNIVGSSLLNEIANRTGMSIKPSVPEFYITKKMDLIQLIESKKHPNADEKIIYISTDFLREETELLGKLFLIPSKPNLIQLLEKLGD